MCSAHPHDEEVDEGRDLCRQPLEGRHVVRGAGGQIADHGELDYEAQDRGGDNRGDPDAGELAASGVAVARPPAPRLELAVQARGEEGPPEADLPVAEAVAEAAAAGVPLRRRVHLLDHHHRRDRHWLHHQRLGLHHARGGILRGRHGRDFLCGGVIALDIPVLHLKYLNLDQYMQGALLLGDRVTAHERERAGE